MATGPFAVQHFNRMASYGLAANLLTAPLSTLVIMPALALGAVLEPVGLGGPFLWAAGRGIAVMLWVAETVAGWPGAVRTISSAPSIALPTAFLGLLWLFLWEGRLRWLGAPFAAAVLLWPRAEPPVGWIAAGGANAAVVSETGAAFARPGRQAFATELWARRRGLQADTRTRAWACNRQLCRTLKGRPVIAIGSMKKTPKPSVWRALCRDTDLVILRTRALPPSGLCKRALVLGPDAFAAGGSAEILRDGAGWRVVWANAVRGDRPWTRPRGAS